MDAKGETDGMLEDRKPKESFDSKLCTSSKHRPTAWRGPGLGLTVCTQSEEDVWGAWALL